MKPCIKFGCTRPYEHTGPHAHDEVRTHAAPDPAFREVTLKEGDKAPKERP